MSEDPQQMDDELELYGDDRIASKDAKVPNWLMFTYIFWPLWGIVWFWLYWNGSWGWLDRGYWHELQEAANTTFPIMNMDNPQTYKPIILKEGLLHNQEAEPRGASEKN